MRGPGGFTGGRVVDQLVTQIDLFPTICDLAGIPHPGWLQGTSLLPLIAGEVDRLHDEVFAEVNYHCAYEPQRCVRTERWKYIRRFHEHHGYEKPMPSNCDDGPSKARWIGHGWADRPVAAEQLYDLMFDPVETNNLAGDPAHAGVLAEMRNRLERWMRDTQDPVLNGVAPAPPSAVVNPPDEIPQGGLVSAQERARRARAAAR
jgi:arylsulfatase A-like enzyme